MPSNITETVIEAAAVYQSGDYQKVEAMIVSLLHSEPGIFDALHLLGLVRDRQGDATARVLIEAALHIFPDTASAWANLGKVLLEQGDWDGAEAACLKALDLAPDSFAAQINLANTYYKQHRYELALKAYTTAGGMQDVGRDGRFNMAECLRVLGRLDEAEQYFQAVLAGNPNDANAHFGYAAVLLARGDLENGFAHYEWRFGIGRDAPKRAVYPVPLWDGRSSVNGKTILVLAEQGLGDAIQFARYLPVLASRGAKVVFAAPAPLERLMSHSLEGSAELIVHGSIGRPDFYCALMSLPHCLRTTLDSIPSARYLRIAPEWTCMASQLCTVTKMKVGFAWNANRQKGADIERGSKVRSVPLLELLPLLRRGDIQPVSLQKEVTVSEAKVLTLLPSLLDAGAELKDFADTAAVIANLDLVITVDTSVAHVAGALGKEVWVIVPAAADWRWMQHRSDSPWYPSARVFRQAHSDTWADVLREVADALSERLSNIGR